MPVKIITGPTNNRDGVINNNDLVKMKNDFITETSLVPKPSRQNAFKTHSCFLYKEQIDNLFSQLPGTSILKLNFSLHLNPTNECGSIYSDSLTVVIEAVEDNAQRTVRNNIGEYVVIPAYSNRTEGEKINSGNPCCPSQNGGD